MRGCQGVVNDGLKLSHLDSWGIIAGHLAEVPARIAKRWRRERD